VTARRVGGILLALGVTAAIVALSQVPYAAAPSRDGELRLAWRWRSRPVQRCRALTPDEVARLPVHMRHAQDCTRGLQPYRLRVHVDRAMVVDRAVVASGAEADRPLSVFTRVPLAPGRHEVHIAFAPAESLEARGDTLAATLTLDTTVVLAERRVVLVTVDEERAAFAVRAGP